MWGRKWPKAAVLYTQGWRDCAVRGLSHIAALTLQAMAAIGIQSYWRGMSVCLSVELLATAVSPTKTAELIEIPIEERTFFGGGGLFCPLISITSLPVHSHWDQCIGLLCKNGKNVYVYTPLCMETC